MFLLKTLNYTDYCVSFGFHWRLVRRKGIYLSVCLGRVLTNYCTKYLVTKRHRFELRGTINHFHHPFVSANGFRIEFRKRGIPIRLESVLPHGILQANHCRLANFSRRASGRFINRNIPQQIHHQELIRLTLDSK